MEEEGYPIFGLVRWRRHVVVVADSKIKFILPGQSCLFRTFLRTIDGLPRCRPTFWNVLCPGGHLWFYRIRSKISSIIESTIFTSTMFCSTLFLLYRIGSTVFVSTDVCSKQLMQPHDYCLQEYALQEHDLHPVGCKGMAIQPPSAAIKSEQRFWT